MKTPHDQLKNPFATLLEQQKQLQKQSNAIEGLLEQYKAFETKVADLIGTSEPKPKTAKPTAKPKRRKKYTHSKNRMPINELETRVLRYLSRLKSGVASVDIFRTAVEPHARKADLSKGVNNRKSPLIKARISALLSSLRNDGFVNKISASGRRNVKYMITAKGRKYFKGMSK